MTDERLYCTTCRSNGHSEENCLGLINARIMAYSGAIVYRPIYPMGARLIIGEKAEPAFVNAYGDKVGCVRRTLRYCHNVGRLVQERIFTASEAFMYFYEKGFGKIHKDSPLEDQKTELRRLYILYRMDLPQRGGFHE